MNKINLKVEVTVMVPVRARVSMLVHANDGAVIDSIVKRHFAHKKVNSADIIDMKVMKLIQPDEFLDIVVMDMLEDPKVKVEVNSVDTVDSR